MKKILLSLCLILITLSACSHNLLGEVDTSFGHMILRSAEWSQSFPAGCSMEAEGICYQPEEGYHTLMIWVEPPEGWDEAIVRNGLFDNAHQAVIRASNDSEYNGVSGGIYEGRFYLVFYIADSAHRLELTWFDSAPISIPR